MNLPQRLIRWIARGRVFFDGDGLGGRPLKALSRRFLGVGLGISITFHLTALSVVLILGALNEVPTTTRLVPYTPHQFDLIPPPSLVTTEEGGGGDGGTPGGEPPPGPGHDIRSLGTPANPAFVIGEPTPVPDDLVAPQTTLATQEQLKQAETALVVTDEKPTEKVGMGGTGGGGSGLGGFGGGSGSGVGGSGGEGAPGTWRYDTPPNPRRLITSVQPRSLRDVEGTVKFRLLIDEFGMVVDAIIMEPSGYRELDDLAQVAIRKSLFNPATFRGRTVKAWITFGYGFKIVKR